MASNGGFRSSGAGGRATLSGVSSGVPLLVGVALPSGMLSHILFVQTDLALPSDVGVRLLGEGHDAEA